MLVSLNMKEAQALCQIVTDWLKVMHRLETEGRLERFGSEDVRDVEGILMRVLQKLEEKASPLNQHSPHLPN